MPQHNCTESVGHSRVRVQQHRQKAIFKNPARATYRISEVDGCLVRDGELRCDYLVSEAGAVSVLVELKGGDVDHACDQLLASVEHAKVKPLLEGKIGFLIVCSRYPRIDTTVQRAKQKCAAKYKAGFHVVCGRRELEIRRVVAIDGPY